MHQENLKLDLFFECIFFLNFDYNTNVNEEVVNFPNKFPAKCLPYQPFL